MRRQLRQEQRADGRWLPPGTPGRDLDAARTSLGLMVLESPDRDLHAWHQPHSRLWLFRSIRDEPECWQQPRELAATLLALTAATTQAQCPPPVRDPIQRAADRLLRMQEADGCWRGDASATDLALPTAWSLLALHTLRRGGWLVPPSAFTRAAVWAEDTSKAGEAHAATAALLAHLATDAAEETMSPPRAADPLRSALREALAQRVAANPPRAPWPEASEAWFLASAALHAQGGDAWISWRERLQPLLLPAGLHKAPPDSAQRRASDRALAEVLIAWCSQREAWDPFAPTSPSSAD